MTSIDPHDRNTLAAGPASHPAPRSVRALADLLSEAATEAAAFARASLEQPEALDGCVGSVLACAETCAAAAEALRSSVGACWTTRRQLLEAAAEQTRRCAELCERIEHQASFCRRWSSVSRACSQATASVLAVLDEMLAQGWPEPWPTSACATSRWIQ